MKTTLDCPAFKFGNKAAFANPSLAFDPYDARQATRQGIESLILVGQFLHSPNHIAQVCTAGNGIADSHDFTDIDRLISTFDKYGRQIIPKRDPITNIFPDAGRD